VSAHCLHTVVPSLADDESRFQHGVPCRRSPQRRWSCIAGLHVDHICRPTGREDTPPLSQLLSHHRRNLHGCKVAVNHWRHPYANIPQLGFVIPFGAQPEQCYDKITPNDMYSSLTCAFSGAFILSGGMSIGVWIFIRALSMHLQICWDVTPGKKFFYWAQGLGWSIAATFFTLTITITGVSFRFGDVCHVNAEHSMEDFWGPLLAISGGAMVIQIAT